MGILVALYQGWEGQDELLWSSTVKLDCSGSDGLDPHVNPLDTELTPEAPISPKLIDRKSYFSFLFLHIHEDSSFFSLRNIA